MMQPNGWLVQENSSKLQVYFCNIRTSGPVYRKKHQLRSFPEKGCTTKDCTAKRKRWVAMEWNSTADEEDDIWCINCLINLYKRRHPTTPHLVWPPLGPNDDLLRLILLSVIFFYHLRSTTVWEFSKKMCTGHQYKEHLWKINSQRRVADGIDGQYIFWFSWKLIFSTSAKMQTSKRKLKSTTQDVSNVNGCKRKINEKMPFLNIANILLTFFSVQKPYCNGK